MRLRKLNASGMDQFRGFIRNGANETIPYHLIDSPATSESIPDVIDIDIRPFDTRFAFGVYLNDALKKLSPASIGSDSGLWSSLALCWFDMLCPKSKDGKRQPGAVHRYILDEKPRVFYRHLVRSPWNLVREHGENARFLLISPKEQGQPLSVGGELLEQIASRRRISSSKLLIEVANGLYFDQRAGRPKAGAAGVGQGSARRFGDVLQQLTLTYDPEVMKASQFAEILPKEFDRWRG